jgi:hypothetical protein
MLKTPAARQVEFASMVDQIIRFALENAHGANPSLFRDVQQGYRIDMPEISAKDISRVGQAAASIMSGMDSALSNRTMSRQGAVQVTCTLLKQLGVDLDPAEVIAQADQDREEAEERADDLMASTAAAAAARGRQNPPVPGDDDEGDDDPDAGDE